MPKYLGRTYAYDPRSGFRVPYEDMVPDGEEPGLIVAKAEADQLNMQRYPVPMFPEGLLPISFPPNETNPDTINFGQIFDDWTFAFIAAPEVTVGTGAFQLLSSFSDLVILGYGGFYHQFLVRQPDGSYLPLSVRMEP
jgi:hypothetical protein